jgi:hypothetical protein
MAFLAASACAGWLSMPNASRAVSIFGKTAQRYFSASPRARSAARFNSLVRTGAGSRRLRSTQGLHMAKTPLDCRSVEDALITRPTRAIGRLHAGQNFMRSADVCTGAERDQKSRGLPAVAPDALRPQRGPKVLGDWLTALRPQRGPMFAHSKEDPSPISGKGDAVGYG